jgi:predicted nucleic acid-binding protein
VADFTIVDTDILIDAGRGISEAFACLQRLESQSTLAVSAITQMELFIGCRNKSELQQTEKFLERFVLLKLSEQISDRATDLLKQYRLSHGLLIADALIASTAITFDVEFISKNQRDYQFIKGLNLLSYP